MKVHAHLKCVWLCLLVPIVNSAAKLNFLLLEVLTEAAYHSTQETAFSARVGNHCWKCIEDVALRLTEFRNKYCEFAVQFLE